MYKTLHKKQGSVTVQLRFARSSVTFCAKRDTTGNMYLDVVDVIRTKFISTVQGTGIRLMVVASYVMLMNHMGASKVLAAAVGRVLVKLKSPYMILGGVFVAGCILKIFITSQVSLGLLFMATIFPILVSLGVSKLSAAVVLITIGMMDYGPNDSSAIFGATEVLGVTPMEFFLHYEGYVCAVVILVMAVFYSVYLNIWIKRNLEQMWLYRAQKRLAFLRKITAYLYTMDYSR